MNILEIRDSELTNSIEIKYELNDGKIVSSYSNMEDSQFLLKVFFNNIKNLIPKKHLTGKVEMCLYDGEIDENENINLDIYFYIDGEFDEDETPILCLSEEFVTKLKKLYLESFNRNYPGSTISKFLKNKYL